MATGTMIVKGMHDRTAADKVTQSLKEVWGVENVAIDLDRCEAIVSYDELAASFHDFQQAVLEMGFEIVTANGKTVESLQDWQLQDRDGGGNSDAARL